jgi:hypothetical protein
MVGEKMESDRGADELGDGCLDPDSSAKWVERRDKERQYTPFTRRDTTT